MNKKRLKRKLFTLAQRTLPNKTIDNCFMRGESGCFNQFDYNHEREVNLINPDRATECAMTDVGEDLLKIACHSEDNNILSPKKLLKGLQEDLSLNAQDDVRDFLTNENYLQPKQPSCLATLSPAAFPETNHSPLTTHNSPKRKVAFTLAEVLITLGIIGVVAAITMPVLLSNVQDRVKQKRVENIKQKLSKVTDKMAVQSGLIGYGDTMSFVQEMSRHMKLAKICDNNHISDCWPTKEVDLNKDGTTWEIAKTKNARTLLIPENIRDNWMPTVGLVTADGVSMILSYDKNCDFDVDQIGLSYGSSSDLSTSTSCLSGMFDWNGGKNPNKLGDDVIPLGVAKGLGSGCAFEVNDKCFTAPFKPKPMKLSDCPTEKKNLGISTCCTSSDCYSKGDFWAGAVKQCGGIDNIPTLDDLAELKKLIYKNGKMDKSVAESLGFSVGSSGNFYVFSNSEKNSIHVYGQNFYPTSSKSDIAGRNADYYQTICIGK